jgi:hypothetical protein
MSDTAQSIRDDIAFMRALAEAGQRSTSRPEALIVWGSLFGAASLYNWLSVTQQWRPATSVAYVWLGAAVLFALYLLVRKSQGAGQQTGGGSAAAAWRWIGTSVWTILIGFGLAVWRTHDLLIFTLIAPIVMAIHGAGWMAGAAATGRGWMRALGGLALLSSLALSALVGRPEQMLLFGLVLICTGTIPGVFLTLRARAKA